MPYILVRGNVQAYLNVPNWKVSVSGLKTKDIAQLSSFSSKFADLITLQYFKHPCVVLTALEVLGYQVVASTSSGQNEIVWTMRREFAEPEPDGSLYGSDCGTFGLTNKEVAALKSRFPNTTGSSLQLVNGSYIKSNPLSVINALSELGYEVVASCGNEAEITWTMKREVPVDLLNMEKHNHDSHDGCCQTLNSNANQTLSEMDFERGIWSAALFNEIDRVSKLLDEGTDPNVADNAGYTALHYAARSNNKPICILLISRGANINAITRAGQATPLHRAASAGNAEIVTLLLDNGANPHLEDSDGMNALHRANKEGHEKIIEILTERFPDLFK